MTTPPSATQPPYPPTAGFPPPVPPRRAGARRAVVVGVVAVVLLLVAGSATGWWLMRDDEDDAPLAGRPRVTDDAAGVSYGIPEGWKHQGQDDLIDAFTSSITPKSADGAGGADDKEVSVVLAGRSDAVPRSALKREAESAAKSNAGFFYPYGSSTVQESRKTTVSERPAHSVVLKVKDSEGGTGRLRLTLIAVDDQRSAFLLGVAHEGGPDQRRQVETVLQSASVT
ncbi:hypothetical protein LHJ74_25280 [Streptomyces sp. N2-109]|uniref:Uncharacterized protein n=1 Tax=Streptomyces gossypii TaxID=2883101 RepID=A0ABT2JZT9_9ACTN|nr:hypothetical protein [Streptomyces gossypii]MCT2593178.1 hypothetical protein [Streptomyces gossypii]